MEAPTTRPSPDVSYPSQAAAIRGIRLSDDIWEALRAEAQRERRTITGQLAIILEQRYSIAPAESN